MLSPDPATAAADGIMVFLRGLNVSQWMLLLYPVVMYFIQRRRAEDDLAVVDTSAAAQIAMTALCGLHVAYRWFATGGPMRGLIAKAPLVWLGVYGVLAVVSATWSQLPSFTLFRGAQLVVFLLLVADALAAFHHLAAIFKFQLCYAAAVCLFGQFSSLLTGASLGELHNSVVPGAIVGVGFLGALVSGRQWRWLYAFILLAMLLATSAATFVASLVGLSVMLVLSRGQRAAWGWLLAGSVAMAVFVAPDALWQAVFFGKTESNVYSASGRIPIWQWTFEIVLRDRPFQGFGFAHGEALARLYNTGGLRMMHMHSAVLSALSNLGLMGLVLLTGIWATAVRQTARGMPERFRPVVLGSIVAVIVNSLAMESVTAPLSIAWIGHVLVFGIGGWAMLHDVPTSGCLLAESPATTAVAKHVTLRRGRRRVVG